MEIEHRLRDANDKLSSLVQESTDMESDHHVFLRQRLHQGHVAIKEAIKVDCMCGDDCSHALVGSGDSDPAAQRHHSIS